jgi:adenylate kinase
MTTDLIIFGPPGSGKGTQAPALAAARGIPHIATGDMLREHRSRGTELGSRADAYMQAGELVPDELVVAMLADRIAQPDAADGFVLDGFPRNVAQAVALDRMLEAAGRVIDALVVLEVPEEEIVRRISGRLVSSSGRVYHELYNPPRVAGVDDVDGSPLLRRATTSRRPCARAIAPSTWPRPSPCGSTTAPQVCPSSSSTAWDARGDRGADRHRARLRAAGRPRVIIRKSSREIDKMAAAGVVVAETLELPAHGGSTRASPPAISTAWPSVTSVGAAASRPSRGSAASRPRSAPRRTT